LESQFLMPSKIGGYLRRLAIEYEREGNELKRSIVSTAKYFVAEQTGSEGWNNESIGHDLFLYLTEEFFRRVPLGDQLPLAEAIRLDLNNCSMSIKDEYWAAVHIDLADEGDEAYRRSFSPLQKVAVNPDTISIWKPGEIRLFISHRDAHKKLAFSLAEALEPYGISCFVAHDTIQATKEWRREILNGLETMEAMLVFLTDDFRDSSFTNQEVGFALGRNVPILSLKLGFTDPPGFISHEQALKGDIGAPASSASKVYGLLVDKLELKSRINSGLISAFLSSPSWSDTSERFDRMAKSIDSLSDAELELIIKGFKINSQLYQAAYLNNKYNRLIDFLTRATGKAFVIEGRAIREI
jgi:hypothetical protein